jgi:beta-exotoxin I transport system permease protein
MNPMLSSVFLKTVRDLRRSLLWWSLGLAGLVAMLVAVYPTVRDNPDLTELVKQYPEALKSFLSFGGGIDYTSGAGYLGSELFSFMIPLLFLVAAIGAGARAIAGEEEKGTLDLLLANPVSRGRVVLEKLGALVFELLALGLVLWVGLVVGSHAAQMKVSAVHLGAAAAAAVLLGLAFGTIALFIGAASGKRGLAAGLSAALAVAAYVVNSLAPLVSSLEPLQKLTPIYHYASSDPLRHGLEASHVSVLAGIALVAAVLAVAAFNRRDISY